MFCLSFVHGFEERLCSNCDRILLILLHWQHLLEKQALSTHTKIRQQTVSKHWTTTEIIFWKQKMHIPLISSIIAQHLSALRSIDSIRDITEREVTFVLSISSMLVTVGCGKSQGISAGVVSLAVSAGAGTTSSEDALGVCWLAAIALSCLSSSSPIDGADGRFDGTGTDDLLCSVSQKAQAVRGNTVLQRGVANVLHKIKNIFYLHLANYYLVKNFWINVNWLYGTWLYCKYSGRCVFWFMYFKTNYDMLLLLPFKWTATCESLTVKHLILYLVCLFL